MESVYSGKLVAKENFAILFKIKDFVVRFVILFVVSIVLCRGEHFSK